jgi:tripartite motif-containing protein 71
LYVTRRYESNVLVFGGTGSIPSQWGSEGRGPGQFRTPFGVAVAPNGTVYVADSGTHRIQAFCVAP